MKSWPFLALCLLVILYSVELIGIGSATWRPDMPELTPVNLLISLLIVLLTAPFEDKALHAALTLVFLDVLIEPVAMALDF